MGAPLVTSAMATLTRTWLASSMGNTGCVGDCITKNSHLKYETKTILSTAFKALETVAATLGVASLIMFVGPNPIALGITLGVGAVGVLTHIVNAIIKNHSSSQKAMNISQKLDKVVSLAAKIVNVIACVGVNAYLGFLLFGTLGAIGAGAITGLGVIALNAWTWNKNLPLKNPVLAVEIAKVK